MTMNRSRTAHIVRENEKAAKQGIATTTTRTSPKKDIIAAINSLGSLATSNGCPTLCVLRQHVKHQINVRLCPSAAIQASPVSYIDPAVRVEGNDVRKPLVPALFVHQRLVKFVFARVGVHPAILCRDPDLLKTTTNSGYDMVLMHLPLVRSAGISIQEYRGWA